jgi:hypothetical protein
MVMVAVVPLPEVEVVVVVVSLVDVVVVVGGELLVVFVLVVVVVGGMLLVVVVFVVDNDDVVVVMGKLVVLVVEVVVLLDGVEGSVTAYMPMPTRMMTTMTMTAPAVVEIPLFFLFSKSIFFLPCLLGRPETYTSAR